MSIDIEGKYKTWMESRNQGKTLQSNLRASSFGHPCERLHYYSLTEYRDPPSTGLQSIFDLGRIHEKHVIDQLVAMGFQVEAQQKQFRLESPLITAHIDGMLSEDGKEWFAFDAKSINQWDWETLSSAEDFIYSKKPHQRNYIAQILLYQLVTNAEQGCLILSNKQTGRLKAIWTDFNQHVAILDDAIKRAERVYDSLKKKEISERTDTLDLCLNCDWRKICLPDLKTAPGVKLVEGSEDLIDDITKMEELREAHKDFQALEKRNKSPFKEVAAGDYIVGDWLVRCKDRPRKSYEIPEDVKKEYEKEGTSRYINFLPVAGGTK